MLLDALDRYRQLNLHLTLSFQMSGVFGLQSPVIGHSLDHFRVVAALLG